MAKADVIAAGIAAVQAGLSDAFGVAYDSSFSEGVASVPVGSGGGFTQADIDAAVAADKAALQPQIDALTGQVAALQADDDSKTKIIAGIQALLMPTPAA